MLLVARFTMSRMLIFYLQDPVEAAEIKKRRTFRKFSYRGIDLDQYVAYIYTTI